MNYEENLPEEQSMKVSEPMAAMYPSGHSYPLQNQHFDTAYKDAAAWKETNARLDAAEQADEQDLLIDHATVIAHARTFLRTL